MSELNQFNHCDLSYFCRCTGWVGVGTRVAKGAYSPPQSFPIYRDANRQALAYCSQVLFRFHLSILILRKNIKIVATGCQF